MFSVGIIEVLTDGMTDALDGISVGVRLGWMEEALDGSRLGSAV